MERLATLFLFPGPQLPGVEGLMRVAPLQQGHMLLREKGRLQDRKTLQ
jgi:hypothetical protein